jgi:hypothetical protein
MISTLLTLAAGAVIGILVSVTPPAVRLRARLVAWWERQREDMRG